jgi:hypothetical protein
MSEFMLSLSPFTLHHSNFAPYGSIARDLNQRGFTTMFGKRFNATAVRRTVSNPAYADKIVACRKRRGNQWSVDRRVDLRDGLQVRRTGNGRQHPIKRPSPPQPFSPAGEKGARV